MDTVTTVRLPGWSNPVIRAAEWLREHLARPDYETIDDDFARYFRCRVVKNDEWNCVDDCAVFVEFDEAEAAMFLLRWA